MISNRIRSATYLKKKEKEELLGVRLPMTPNNLDHPTEINNDDNNTIDGSDADWEYDEEEVHESPPTFDFTVTYTSSNVSSSKAHNTSSITFGSSNSSSCTSGNNVPSTPIIGSPPATSKLFKKSTFVRKYVIVRNLLLLRG